MAPVISIVLPYRAPADLSDRLYRDIGTYPEIEDPVRSLDQLPGYAMVVTTLSAFIGGLAGQFGAAAAARLQRLFATLRDTAPQPLPEIRLVDAAGGAVVVVDVQTLADERAMRSLLTMERDVFQSDVELRWDRRAGRWRASRS
jgi:hypothetical protein